MVLHQSWQLIDKHSEENIMYNGVIYSFQDKTIYVQGIPQAQAIVLDNESVFNGKFDFYIGTRKAF